MIKVRHKILFLLMMLIFSFHVYAQQNQFAELLKIKDSKFNEFGLYKYPPVSFSHELHTKLYRVKCSTCHHVYENGKNIWTEKQGVQKCSNCHGNSKAELTTAYHMKCWGCHERLKEIYLKVDAPVHQCYRCHLKNVEIEKIRIQQKLKKSNRKLMNAIKQLELEGFYK